MKSIAVNTYPQIVWRDGRKMLWNPIHRKPLKNRPEERVRLRIIEYLLRSGWSKHRITTEEAVGKLADSDMRTDIICYTQQFEPKILIECKAEYVPISEKTAEQVARYNQKVSARYLLMTNGMTDFWYEVTQDDIQSLKEIPDPLKANLSTPDHDFEAWQRRGFAGSKASPELRKWVAEFFPVLWFRQPSSEIQFLTFDQELSDLNLSHYYFVKTVSEQRRLALSTLTTAYGGSRLVAIFNENNQNRAVLEVNLDLLLDGKAKNSAIYSDRGVQTIDTAADLALPECAEINLITESIARIFDEYVN